MPTRIYVVRHAETDKNSTKKSNDLESSFVMEKNSSLNRNGKFQASILGHYFRDNNMHINAIYSSPLLRTIETAETIMKHVEKADDEETIDFVADMKLLSGSYMAKDVKHNMKVNEYIKSVGNTLKDREKLSESIRNMIKELTEIYADGIVILVTHNHIIDIFYNLFVDPEYHKLNKKYKVGNCHIGCIDFENLDTYKVVFWNKKIKLVYELID